MLFDIREESKRQKTLTNFLEAPGQRRLKEAMEAVDKINGKHDRGKIKIATQGKPEAFWHMCREKLTGRLTTDWGSLPRIGG